MITAHISIGLQYKRKWNQWQDCRQKIYNRGGLLFCRGTWNSKLYWFSVSYFNSGELGALFGGISPPYIATGLISDVIRGLSQGVKT